MNIQIIRIVFAVAVLVLTMTSCSDFVEIEQPGRFSADNAFTNTEDLQLGLLGTYNTLDISQDITFSSTFTDEIAIGFDNGGQGLGDGRFGFILNSTSVAPDQFWNTNYSTINSATRVLEAAATITPDADEQAQFNAIRGQAFAIRAYAHFRLWSYFTPDLTDGGSPSVIVVNTVPSIEDEFGRNTAGEVIAQIESDLDQAENLLAGFNNGVTFINGDFVTALRARMAAYREDYGTARSLAESLLSAYPLSQPDDYFGMFQDFNDGEVIFKMERSIGDDYDNQGVLGGGWAGSLFAFVDATRDGSPYFEMSRTLFNLIPEGDIRFDVLIDPTSLIDPDFASSPDPRTTDILVFRKYPGSDGQPLLNDLKVFRSSEMALIAAEAAASTGDLAAAASFVSDLRDARLGGDSGELSYGSAQEALFDIMQERRVEFAIEGHRYLDIKRLGIRSGSGVDRDPIDCSVNGACQISSDDFRFTLPIPQDELNANSIIRDQQNPGY
jgi:hypothetical protein